MRESVRQYSWLLIFAACIAVAILARRWSNQRKQRRAEREREAARWQGREREAARRQRTAGTALLKAKINAQYLDEIDWGAVALDVFQKAIELDQEQQSFEVTFTPEKFHMETRTRTEPGADPNWHSAGGSYYPDNEVTEHIKVVDVPQQVRIVTSRS